MPMPRLLFPRLMCVCAGLVDAPALAEQQVLLPDPSGQVGFVTPSGNAGCRFTPAGGTEVYRPADGGPELVCERVEPEYFTIILGAEGPATLIADPGEMGCCGATNTLAYGNYAILEPFICFSAREGLNCETLDDRHGLFLSRTVVETH